MERLFVSKIHPFLKRNLTFLVGRNQSNRANFIRVPANAPPTYVKQLLVRKCDNKVNVKAF